MKDEALSDFMINFQPQGSTIEVDAPWLQKQLRDKELALNNETVQKRRIKRLEATIENLELVLQVLKAGTAPRRRLDIYS